MLGVDLLAEADITDKRTKPRMRKALRSRGGCPMMLLPFDSFGFRTFRIVQHEIAERHEAATRAHHKSFGTFLRACFYALVPSTIYLPVFPPSLPLLLGGSELTRLTFVYTLYSFTRCRIR